MIVSEADAKRLTAKVLALSKADSCSVTLGGHARTHLRFALNSVTTAGEQDDLSLAVTSSFGTRSGSARTNEFTDAALAQFVRKSEEIARLAPPDPEFIAPFGPQEYLAGKTWFERTARTTPADMAAATRPALDLAAEKQVTAAGFFDVGDACSAMATSKGLFAYDRHTGALFSISARTSDGTGAGWAGVNYQDIEKL